MKNRQLLEGALASIKTVRKNLGGVTLIGQSAEDLGENADSIVNSCTSFLFLRDATFNRKRYAELFKMNEQQIALFESLQEREALYMRRDGLSKVVKLNLDARSYATFSTKPKDRVRRSKLIETYGLHTPASLGSDRRDHAQDPHQLHQPHDPHRTQSRDRRLCLESPHRPEQRVTAMSGPNTTWMRKQPYR